MDEQIVPIKNRNCLKQYLLLKPHKWGYKLFVLNSVVGYIYNFEIYTGGDYPRLTNEPDLGAVGNVVIRLCRILPNHNYKLYYDDFYSSIPLSVYLHKRGMMTLATFQRNRIPNLPLPLDDQTKKKSRGHYEE